MNTEEAGYAEQRLTAESAWWKRLLDVQRPYRSHLRRLRLGLVLEIAAGSAATSTTCAAPASRRSQPAGGGDRARARPGGVHARGAPRLPLGNAGTVRFAPLLARPRAHASGASDGVGPRLPRSAGRRGRVVAITPQEAGFRSDPTHVEFMDFDAVEGLLRGAGLDVQVRYSFPLPRLTGPVFKYNEFVTIARKRVR